MSTQKLDKQLDDWVETVYQNVQRIRKQHEETLRATRARIKQLQAIYNPPPLTAETCIAALVGLGENTEEKDGEGRKSQVG